MPALDDRSLAFALGFIAGEGSFYVTASVDERYAYNVCVRPRFSLYMGVYEEEILDQICSRFGFGSVTDRKKGYQWVVSTRQDCHEMRDLIEDHIEAGSLFATSKKYEAFETWSKALDILEPGHSLSKSDLKKLARLKDDINYMSSSSSWSTDHLIQVIEDADAE